METKKKDKMYGYKIIKAILGVVYKLYYNPKVIGAENIPETGSILMTGNHIHVMDQNSVLIHTKRPVHYMAKKEYFDSPKTRWFFKMAGCIPVNRKIHDDSAKSAAMEVLENGHALGLFPEGTRNGLKDEKIKELYDCYGKTKEVDYETFYKNVKKNRTSQVEYVEELVKEKVIEEKEFIDNLYKIDDFLKKKIEEKVITEEDYYNHILLPFKFGAVSMAQKTDSYLVPFGITGDYKFRSKNLTVRIGKPFKVSKEEDLEVANKKLEAAIRELIQENLKNIGK